MFTIGKVFEFASAHQLHGLEEGHKCGRLHGHNYKVEVILSSNEVNNDGFVFDYGKMDFIKKYIDNELDHKNLNDIFDFQTSAENLAQYLYHYFKLAFSQIDKNLLVQEVVVSETPKTFASYKQ
tara:strand:+ start:6253 stop:6624 length:372 start_codon:yes stop_codon:yes gene_type:complete